MCAAFTRHGTKYIMVEKAIELFKERGVEHVSVKDICDGAGVTRNAFYYHFESKELLFDSIGDYVSMISKDRVIMLYGQPTYYQQVWEFYKAYLATELEMGADIMNHICISRTMKGRADYFSYIDDKLAREMTKLIAMAQKEGQISNPSSQEELMWVSYSIIRGVNIKWCFQWGECDLMAEASHNLDILFLPKEGYAIHTASETSDE